MTASCNCCAYDNKDHLEYWISWFTGVHPNSLNCIHVPLSCSSHCPFRHLKWHQFLITVAQLDQLYSPGAGSRYRQAGAGLGLGSGSGKSGGKTKAQGNTDNLEERKCFWAGICSWDDAGQVWLDVKIGRCTDLWGLGCRWLGCGGWIANCRGG